MPFHHLFTPVKIGDLMLPNRIFMAPMTRLRSTEPGDIPTPLMAEYYAQRASAGLIITEATQVSFQAKGYAGAPGLHTPDQSEAWQFIVDSVHAKGGHCAVQLWHTGRNSHSSLQPEQQAPVAPSAIASGARTSLRDVDGKVIRVETSIPQALDTAGIKQIIRDFATATALARTTGFDLIELHSAHGYLLHQFLSPSANKRDDEYGGSIRNRVRFPLEVVDACIAAWSSQRTGIRIFPVGAFQGLMSRMEGQENENTEEDALYYIAELARRDLAYLHVSEPDWTGGKPLTEEFRREMRKIWPGIIIGAGAYTPEKAEELIGRGFIDAVAFGRRYLANPDLVERIRLQAPVNIPCKEHFYGGGREGYTDYPTMPPA